MTDAEKLVLFREMLAPDDDTDEVLDTTIALAGDEVLNRMYPFGYADGTPVPKRYEKIQLQLAVELYTKRGAEGQASHTENGTTRTWPEKSRLLASIVPHVGSVVRNAEL